MPRSRTVCVPPTACMATTRPRRFWRGVLRKRPGFGPACATIGTRMAARHRGRFSASPVIARQPIPIGTSPDGRGCCRPRSNLIVTAKMNDIDGLDRPAPMLPALRPAHDLLKPVPQMAETRRMVKDIRRFISCVRGVRAVRRQHLHPGSPARRERKKACAETFGLADLRAIAMGRLRGGLTTKIHTVTDLRCLQIALKLTALTGP